MATTTVHHPLLILAQAAGALTGLAAACAPRTAHRVLRVLERAGLREAGWLLFALELAGKGGAK